MQTSHERHMIFPKLAQRRATLLRIHCNRIFLGYDVLSQRISCECENAILQSTWCI